MFCPDCKSTATECSVCGAPDRHGQFLDGRYFCASCQGGTVEGDGQWEDVYRQVTEHAAEVLGLSLRKVPPLVIDDAETLRKRRAEHEVTDGLSGLYLRNWLGQASIHLVSHLPESRGAAVLAHELAHAWQAENCPEEQGIRVREGFAEWVAWRIMEHWHGGAREREVIEARTDDYGRGFRIFRQLERDFGTAHALWYARAVRSEP